MDIFSFLKKLFHCTTNNFMLDNVFASTRYVQGEKLLSSKYHPKDVSECLLLEKDLRVIEDAVATKRYFSVRSDSGNGATCCVRHIARNAGFYVHTLSCSVGCSEIVRLLERNMKNVLLALQSSSKKVMFLIKDIEGLKKNERSQIINVIEEKKNIHSVVFFNEILCYSKWDLISLSAPDYYQKMVHLCWIVAEESIPIKFEVLEELGTFRDFRNAINLLSFPEGKQRDYSDIDDFSKILFTHETLNVNENDLERVVTFSDMLVFIDISDFRATKDWFIELASEYSDSYFCFKHKQTFIARNAQLCHRTACLKRACAALNIDVLEMGYCSQLHRHSILEFGHSQDRTPDSESKSRALYTVAKLNATALQCKSIKKALSLA